MLTPSTASGIVVIRPESGLFYANADNVRREILRVAVDPCVPSFSTRSPCLRST